MDFFNFFPGLEKSNEAYFGLDSPLSQDLINYANKLKELIQNVDDIKFKNREFMKKINSILIDFGEAVKLDINAENVNADIPVDFKDEKILLQGAVDLAFVEDNQLVIVDYKTDRVKDIKKLKDVYSKQLELYKIAMEKSTDYKVKECIIYSLYLDEFILI